MANNNRINVPNPNLNPEDLQLLKSLENDVIVKITHLVGSFLAHGVAVQEFLSTQPEPAAVVIANPEVFVYLIRKNMVDAIKELHLLEMRAKAFAYLRNLTHGHQFDDLIDKLSSLPDLPPGLVLPSNPQVRFPLNQEYQEFIQQENWYPAGTPWRTIHRHL
jgi:hypothetical protein